MKKEQIMLVSLLTLLAQAPSLHAQQKKDDGRQGKLVSPEEKEYLHQVHLLSQKHTPRTLGKWKMVEEAWEPTRDMRGLPVNTGIYNTGYWIKLKDITPTEERKAYDSIQAVMKGKDYNAIADSVTGFMLRHSCTIRIEYNTTQLPLQFYKGSIKTVPVKLPLVYRIVSNNASASNSDKPANRQATVLGMGPHSKMEVFYYNPASSTKNGYARAESVLDKSKHPFSIQTIDIRIDAPHGVAELFLKEMDLPGLNDLIGKVLVQLP